MRASKPLAVSVVVCTRNRHDDVARCLKSLEHQSQPPLEVLVIDQSDEPIANGDFFHVHATAQRGTSKARNEGISLARGDVIAFIDDDCTVTPNWLRSISDAFERHPDADLIFGQVLRVSDDPDEYVPEYIVKEERRLSGRLAVVAAHGFGASMYVRAPAAKRIGPFDVELSYGGRFKTSEDWDYIARALTAGLIVVETPDIVVNHYGGRRYSSGDAGRLLRGNAYSHGAFHAKLLRCGEPVAVVLMLNELWIGLSLLRPLNMLRKKPTNAARLWEYAKGIIASWSRPVDRTARVYT